LRTYGLLAQDRGRRDRLDPALPRHATGFQHLYRSFEPGSGLFLLVRFVTVFGLMLLPVMLMGMTLPVIVGAFARSKRAYDLEAGTLYGINTLGAVAGTLAAAFFLIPALGILKTCVAAGILDMAIAGLALVLDRRTGRITDSLRGRAAGTTDRRATDSTTGAGSQGADAEPVSAPPSSWQRESSPAGPSGSGRSRSLRDLRGSPALRGRLVPPARSHDGTVRLAFAVMLAIYLIGIGIGSAAAAPGHNERALRLASMALLEGLLGWIGIAASANSPSVSAGLFRWALPVGKTAFIVSQMGQRFRPPPCLIMGALFPVVVRAARESGRDISPRRRWDGSTY
jgi:hypothetical protein